jgi:hypothetical protein
MAERISWLICARNSVFAMARSSALRRLSSSSLRNMASVRIPTYQFRISDVKLNKNSNLMIRTPRMAGCGLEPI